MAQDSGIRINFSSEEASSEARDFQPIPTGTYPVYIHDVELKESTSEKNPGKPYWALQLVVDGGAHDGRYLFANVMLWEGAAYSLAQLLKATGNEDALKTGKIPPAESFIGKRVAVTVKRQLDTYAAKKAREAGEQNPTPEYKNEVKGFKSADGVTAAVGSASSGGNSLLP